MKLRKIFILLIIISIICGCERKLTPEPFKFYESGFFDTTGIYKSPIKIVSAKYIKYNYSDLRSVQLIYKNVSSKIVEAIRFEWYGENAFGEIAENGHGSGVSDEIIEPNQTRTGVWKTRSKDGKNIILAKPVEAVFSDGSKWKLNE